MLHPTRFAILLFAMLGATACTTLTPEQRSAACRATDWRSYGLNDGTLGVPITERTEKFADCAALGHPADIAAYQAARAEGLKAYCTVENGYDVGYAGRRYRNVCPPELEQSFRQGYDQGRKERPVRDYYYPYYGFGGFYHPYWSFYRYPLYYPRPFRDHH
jgi:hypothetical protein